jgi:class 3 adenylate cyclase
MPAQSKKLAILFADISGSTALYEKLGDVSARQLIARCLGIMKGALNTYQGTLVKTIGDEILCTFPSAEAAMNAACEMQNAVKTDNLSSKNPLYIRIGFNYGDVLCEEGDIYGDAVNVAARVTEITRANQIMTTVAVVNVLPLAVQDKIRKILRADLKGKQEQQDIFQVMWELEDMGSTRIGMSAYRKPQAEGHELTLTYRAQTFKINLQNLQLQLGRDDNCQLVIKNDFVSRQHADIVLRSGNFILSDHSSNGTYVRTADNMLRLNREDTTLRGKGFISLGQPYADNTTDLLEFSITSNN